MSEKEALQIIWDYMHMYHELEKADVIMALGCYDVDVAERAAELWLQGYAPYLVCTGSGTVHSGDPNWKVFEGSTEAEVFAVVAKEKGVPESAILIENKSQNTGQNFEFTVALLKEKQIPFNTVIAVHKPYMERRSYATGKVWLPDSKLIMTSQHISLEQYANHYKDRPWIDVMVGDLQRIKEYPKKGFQIEQEIPDKVWNAFELLVSIGYDNRLII